MKVKQLLLCAVILSSGAIVRSQEVQLNLDWNNGVLRLTYDTSADRTYELQHSSDLKDWEGVEPARAGDGLLASHEIAAIGEGMRFFRLWITATLVDLAPNESEAIEMFVGTTFEGYAFTSATRFHWFGEGGEWSYEKTGPDTALVVFTYDEDGNNAQVYREEVRLTFATPTSGSYRYSEFNGGIEDPRSVSSAPFSF